MPPCAPISSLYCCSHSFSACSRKPHTRPRKAAHHRPIPMRNSQRRRRKSVPGWKKALSTSWFPRLRPGTTGSWRALCRGIGTPPISPFSGASITQGWEPTLLRYRQRYQAEGKEMGKLEFQDLKIDVLGRRAAVVTGKWQLTMSDGKQPHGLFTLVMKKMPGGWRIVHDHT